MKTLGLIPARGGSKGVSRKNIKLLCGKPLLQYTAESALASRRLSRVILSTEDAEIATIGTQCGLEVPFLRPADLACDDTPMIEVVLHALRWIGQTGEEFDALCLLQPTNPLRRAGEIDACIDLLESSGADSVVTVLPVPEQYNPHWVYFTTPDGHLQLSTGEETPVARRQDLPPAFHREGSVYVTRRDVVLLRKSLYGERLVGYQLDPGSRVNIDTPAHWKRAEELLARKG
jgi:CMP-N,N'-diacetyllegionaminic acid synthase